MKKYSFTRFLGGFIITSVLLLSIDWMNGCTNRNLHVTNLPLGVTEGEVKNWLAAVGAVKEVGRLDKEFVIAVRDLHTNPLNGHDLIPEHLYQETLEYFGKIAQAGINSENILEKVPDHFGTGTQQEIRAIVGDLFTELQNKDIQQLTGLDKTQATSAFVILQELQTTVGVLLNLLNLPIQFSSLPVPVLQPEPYLRKEVTLES